MLHKVTLSPLTLSPLTLSPLNFVPFTRLPQIVQNDLGRGTCPAAEVVLVVIDEAHKATGNHAYCQVNTNQIPTRDEIVIVKCITKS